MKKTFLLSLALMFVFSISKAQTTAMQLTGLDCNGVSHDLFSDLDAGKAVILHFFMPSCGSCPPPAQKIQAMANKILLTYPGKITAYAMPYQNSTTCTYTASWVSSNNLSLYMPYDSGATQVAHYGGFGMPTVVLLGGADHRVMFSTLNFNTSDTTRMRDSILGLLTVTATEPVIAPVSEFNVFPNPTNEIVSIQYNLNDAAEVNLQISDLAGRNIAVLRDEKSSGFVSEQFNTSALANGYYFVRLTANGTSITRKLNVIH